MTDTISRRSLLKSSSLLGVAALAGCATDSNIESENRRTTAKAADQPIATATAQRHQHETSTDDGFSEEIRKKAQRVGVEVQKSVVSISFDGGRGGGTGWFIDDGYIITNSHIARQSRTFQIETFDGTTGTAERVGYHDDMLPDIALLETDISGPAPLSTVESSTLEKGQPMVIVGHPGRVGKWVISLGPFQEYAERADWLLTDAPTQSGNSGSPLVTLDGNAVGCVSGSTLKGERPEKISRSTEVFETFPEPEKVSTSTPIETVQKWMNEWK